MIPLVAIRSQIAVPLTDFDTLESAEKLASICDFRSRMNHQVDTNARSCRKGVSRSVQPTVGG